MEYNFFLNDERHEENGTGRGKPGTRKSIRVFAAASFLNDMGSDIIYPIWPLFVTTVLKANMAALGFLDGLGEALVSLSQAASGYFSDRFKRRKVFIWTGYLCGSLSRLGYAISAVWQHLIPFKVLDRVGKIRSAPRDAIVADISTDQTRGRNFGLLRTMDNAGAVHRDPDQHRLPEAPGLSGFSSPWRPSPPRSAPPVILLNIKETKARREKSSRDFPQGYRRNLRLYIVLNAVFALGAFSYSFLMIYAAKSGFKIEIRPRLYLIYTAAAAAFFPPLRQALGQDRAQAGSAVAYLFWAVRLPRDHFRPESPRHRPHVRSLRGP